MFFDYCPTCGKMFLDEDEWNAHQRKHRSPKNEPIDMTANLMTPDPVPGGDVESEEDARLQKTKHLREVKKELTKLGVECQTMTEVEAEAALSEVKAQAEAAAQQEAVEAPVAAETPELAEAVPAKDTDVPTTTADAPKPEKAAKKHAKSGNKKRK